MNDRLKELSKVAWGFAHNTNHGLKTNHDAYSAKFAELIIQECLDIVEGEDDGSADTKSVRLAMLRMKQHFGVEV